MRGLRKLQSKKMMTFLLAASMLMTLTGCGGSAKSESAVAYSAATNGSYKEMATADMALIEGSFDGGAGAVEVPAEAVAEEASAKTLTERKLIKTVDMNVETQEFETLMTTIETRVSELGGYIENMNTYNGSSYYSRGGTRHSDMTIRIPKNHLDTFLNTVSGISNVIRRSDNVEDVTLEYVDLASHRDALRTEQTRLLELLEKAESIEDIITIEQRLSNVRYQLESMESQLRTYDNQVDYSTVYLNVEEVEVLTPVEEETVWERISFGFVDSLHNIGDGFVEFGIWFVINLPYMVVWAVIIAVIVLIIIGVSKSGKKNKIKKEGWIPTNIAPMQNVQSEDKTDTK